MVELRGGKREHREADQEPEEQEEDRAVLGRLRPHPRLGEHRGRSGHREDPGEAVVPELLDEVREAPSRRGGVHAQRQALEVVVDDEALEEGLAFVVPPVEGEHRAVPGSTDGEHDQRAGAEVEPAQAVPLAGDHAVEQGHRAGQGEAEDPLGQRGEAHEAIERGGPAFVGRPLVVQQNQHQARHRAVEQADEDGVGHRLADEEHEQGAGEEGEGPDHRRPPGEQPVRHHEEQQGAEHGDRHIGEPHGPLRVDPGPAIGPVGIGDQHAGGGQPEVERGLGEEPGRLPPGMDVVAAGDHLPRHLAVVRLPRVPEARRPQPGNEQQGRERDEPDGQAPLRAERRKPAQPGDLLHEGR